MGWTPFKDFHKVGHTTNPILPFQDPLYKFEPVEVGGEIFAYCKTPGIPCDPLPFYHFALLQGFVFNMEAVTLESGKPVTRILATCTPNIVLVRIKFGR